MIPERLAWIGGVIMACVGIYVSFVPIANDLGKITVAVLGALVILAAILMFPWRRHPDGSGGRLLARLRVSGDNNHVQIAGDHANQVMGRGRIRGAADRENG